MLTEARNSVATLLISLDSLVRDDAIAMMRSSAERDSGEREPKPPSLNSNAAMNPVAQAAPAK